VPAARTVTDGERIEILAAELAIASIEAWFRNVLDLSDIARDVLVERCKVIQIALDLRRGDVGMPSRMKAAA
jgi:hypothetical protein